MFSGLPTCLIPVCPSVCLLVASFHTFWAKSTCNPNMSRPHERRPRSLRSQPPRLPPSLKYDEIRLPVPQSRRLSARRPHSPPTRRRPLPLSPIRDRSDGHHSHRSTIPRSLPSSRRSAHGSLFSSPLPSDARQTYTPWILNLRTASTTHKCCDARLFRPGHSTDDMGITSDSGTIAVPILPGPTQLFNFDVSVMTLTPTQYTPGARFSELSWPILAAQGFTKHDLHHDHVHDSTMTTTTIPTLCRGRRTTRFSSVIRHPNIPGVDLLWCGYDSSRSPLTFVHMTALEMVDLAAWTEGVRTGVVGQVADMDGRLGWIEPGEDSPLELILRSHGVRP